MRDDWAYKEATPDMAHQHQEGKHSLAFSLSKHYLLELGFSKTFYRMKFLLLKEFFALFKLNIFSVLTRFDVVMFRGNLKK